MTYNKEEEKPVNKALTFSFLFWYHEMRSICFFLAKHNTPVDEKLSVVRDLALILLTRILSRYGVCKY